MFSELAAEPDHDRHRLLPDHAGQRGPARGGALVPRRRRAAAEPVVGDDDQRRHPAHRRARSHLTIAPGAHARPRRSSRSTSSATASATPSTRGRRSAWSTERWARFIIRRLFAMVSRAVRRLGPDVPHLPRHPERRPRRADGRQALRRRSRSRPSAHDWGFNDPLWQQYLNTMSKVFSGDVVSYANSENVVDRIKDGPPRDVRPRHRRRDHLVRLRRRARPVQRGEGAGRLSDRGADRARAHRHIHARVLAGRAHDLLPGLQAAACSRTAGTCR